MRLSRTRPRRGEPLVALINVVFLLLIFLMVAGTMARPLPTDVALIDADDVASRPPPDAAVLRADGTMLYRGQPIDAAAYVAARAAEGEAALRIVPDRGLPAGDLVDTVARLTASGADRVLIVTERGLR